MTRPPALQYAIVESQEPVDYHIAYVYKVGDARATLGLEILLAAEAVDTIGVSAASHWGRLFITRVSDEKVFIWTPVPRIERALGDALN